MALEEINTGGGIGSRLGSLVGLGPSSMRGRGHLSDILYLPNLVPAGILVVYGLLVIWSASLSIAEASIIRQGIGVAVGLVAAAVVWRYDLRSLSGMTVALIVIDITLIFLPYVPGLSYSAKGMTGWIKIPGIGMTFQPSELAKLVTIILVAGQASTYNGKIETIQDYLKLCAVLAGPMALLIVQYLGLTLVVLFAGACIIVCSGAKRSWILATIAIIIVVVALVVMTSMTDGLPHILKEYQLKRLLVFTDASIDPTGDGYNLQQAKIAVGSGGFIGKGIGNASQAGQGFLPEAHTDFVFALLSEEFGFVGATLLLALFAWLMYSAIGLANRCESMYEKLILVGLVGMWVFQVFENIGMNIGLMPITGVPLPFISYGSSSMIVQLMAVGIVQSIWFHRKKSA